MRRLFEGGHYFARRTLRAAFIRGRLLFEVRHLFEEIRYFQLTWDCLLTCTTMYTCTWKHMYTCMYTNTRIIMDMDKQETHCGCDSRFHLNSCVNTTKQCNIHLKRDVGFLVKEQKNGHLVSGHLQNMPFHLKHSYTGVTSLRKQTKAIYMYMHMYIHLYMYITSLLQIIYSEMELCVPGAGSIYVNVQKYTIMYSASFKLYGSHNIKGVYMCTCILCHDVILVIAVYMRFPYH